MEMRNHEVKQVYADLWRQSISRIKTNQCETDLLIRRTDDSRRGLTTLFRPNYEISAAIECVLDKVKQLEPTQYFYPRSDLHLTILSIITCRENFQRNAERDAEYMEIISECAKNIRPPCIRFIGITASPSCLMIQGFPLDNNLRELRENLRNKFRRSNLPHSIDSRYPIKTAHLTVMRFQEPLIRAPEFVRLLEQHRTHEFGTQTMSTLEFVSNDWYLRNSLTQMLGSVVIKP